MTKHIFLEQLAAKLHALPKEERQDALEYYEGYISDAEDEAIAIAELGTPSEVAAGILSNYVQHGPRSYSSGHRTPKRGLRSAYIAILAIFAVPVGLPLALTAVGLIVTLVAVVFSLIVAGAAALLAGILTVVATPFALAHDFWFGMFTGGMGIASVGIGILVLKGGMKLFSGFPAIMRLIQRRRAGGRAVPAGGEPGVYAFPGDPQYANSAPSPHPTSEHHPLTEESTPQGAQHGNSMPSPSQESFATPKPPVRQRVYVLRFAALLILLGAVMFGIAWLNDARGGTIYWSNGRFHIQSYTRGAESELGSEGVIHDAFYTVNIHTTHANVTILPSTNNQAFFSSTREVNVSINGGGLSINQNTRNHRRFFLMDMNLTSPSASEVRLYLPASFFEDPRDSIQVRTTSGRVHVEGDFSDLSVNTSSGRINIGNSNSINNASTIHLRSTSGNITAENISHINTLNVQATSGRIEIRNITGPAGAMTLRAVSGNISVENAYYVHNVNINTTSGRINISNTAWRDINARSTSGNIIIDGDGETTMLNTTSGRVSAQLTGAQSDHALNLHTSSGRVNVNGQRVSERGQFSTPGAGTRQVSIRTTSGRIDLDFGR